MKHVIIGTIALLLLSACTNDLPPLDTPVDPPADPQPPEEPEPPKLRPVDPDPEEPPREQVQVTYLEGSWHYQVEVGKPTPCHTVEHDAVIAESYPEQVKVTLRTQLHTDEPCPTVVTYETIEGTIEATQRASFTITLDGKRIYHKALEGLPPHEGVECLTVYEPVCGQPPMPPCPPGFGCSHVMPHPQTYPNECEMEKAGATLIHEGECETDLVIS